MVCKKCEKVRYCRAAFPTSNLLLFAETFQGCCTLIHSLQALAASRTAHAKLERTRLLTRPGSSKNRFQVKSRFSVDMCSNNIHSRIKGNVKIASRQSPRIKQSTVMVRYHSSCLSNLFPPDILYSHLRVCVQERSLLNLREADLGHYRLCHVEQISRQNFRRIKELLLSMSLCNHIVSCVYLLLF